MNKKTCSIGVVLSEERKNVLAQKAGIITQVANSFMNEFNHPSKAQFYYDGIKVELENVHRTGVRISASPEIIHLRDMPSARFSAYMNMESPLWEMDGSLVPRKRRSTLDILIAVDMAVAMYDAMDKAAKEVR